MRTQGNRDWHWPSFTNPVKIKEWEHFCMSYSVKERRMRLMHNGIVEVEHVRPVEVSQFENYLPSDWFGPNSTIAMKKKCYGVSAMGSFTDFNVWDKELTLEQMRDFTQCKARPPRPQTGLTQKSGFKLVVSYKSCMKPSTLNL